MRRRPLALAAALVLAACGSGGESADGDGPGSVVATSTPLDTGTEATPATVEQFESSPPDVSDSGVDIVDP